MNEPLENRASRRFGLDFVGDIPWGTHFCQFYETKTDLIDILVPYFAEGLRNNEFCMWITSKPLEVEEAKAALEKAVPNLDEYIKKGQIEILPHDEWYLRRGRFSADRVLKGWVRKEKNALKEGFDGLRLTGNTFWVERKHWKSFTDYEATVNDVISSHRMIALCTYSLERCSGNDIIDVVRNHMGTLIRKGERWSLVEDVTQRKKAEEKIANIAKFPSENPFPVLRVAKNGNVLFSNVAGFDLLKEWKCEIGQPVPELWRDAVVDVLRSGVSKELKVNVGDRIFSCILVPISVSNYVNVYGRDITEHKKAEEKILLAKNEWEHTFDSMPDLIAILDNKHRIVRVNKSMAQRLGTTPEECVGLNCFKCVHKLNEPPAFCPHTRTLADGKEHIEEIHEDNLHGDFLVSTTPLFDQQGQIVGSVHVARDITERKQVEQALRESQGDLNRAQAVAKTGSWRLDVHRDVLLWSDETYRMFRIPKGTPLTYEIFLGTVHPDDRSYVDERWKASLRGEPYDIEHRIIVNGEVRWVREKAELELDKNGVLTGGFGTVQDITERKKVEERILAEKQFSDMLIESLPGVFYAINTDAKFLQVNNEFARVIGYSQEEMLKMNAMNLFAGEEKKLIEERIREVFDKGASTAEAHLISKDGKVTPYYFTGVRIEKDGNPILIGMGVDITERKNAEEKIRESERVQTEIRERRQAEEMLRAASLYARSLIEASLDPLVTISAEGKITDVNKATEDATGLSREELIGSDFSDYFIKPDKAREGYQQVFEKGFVRDYPLVIRHKSGKVTDVLYNATVYKNEAGEIQGVFAAARDVTERKQAEDMMRTASLYARSLIEASLDPLVTISAEGKITDVNKATEDATGLSREELIGSDFSTYFTEPDKARTGYQQVFTEGYVRDYPLAIRNKSGKITDVLYNATLYRNEKGEIQGVFAAARDVTERKQAENRIKEQAELLNQAHDAITVRDLNNRIVYWNKGAQRMYGWTEEEAVGKDAGELLFKGKTPPAEDPLKVVLEKGEWSGEFTQVTKDGRNIIIETHWTLMRDNDGNPKSILAINTDITDKKNLEAQMLRAQRMESIGTLASGIAHDLNNVLTPIMLSLQLLQTEVKDEESKKTLDILEKSARRGADLVKQVLTFARGVAGERKPIKVAHLVGEVERIIKETFPKSIEIRTIVSPDLWTVSGDATQLHQVIMNLCLNARDAMPEGGTLSVSADNVYVDEAYSKMHIDAKIGNYVVIAVTDNGVGIPPELRDKIFEPFFTTKERGKGTGLGLSTSLAIVKSHGGFINLYSEVRKGSTFKVYLPIIAGEAEKIEVETPKYLGGKGELVLVVEDEVSICEITRAILESNGYKALIANDGAEAVALYSKNREDISVVLMDMAMPVMDGYMSIRALFRIDPQVKIIAVSGLTENGKVATLAGTVKAFLAKPYSSERLLKTIGEILRSK